MIAMHGIRGSTSAAIADSVEARVREGELPPGAGLPTVRALAAELGVSTATVADAYRVLRTRGVIRTYGRRGTRVSERPPLALRPAARIPEGVRDLAQGNPDPKLLPQPRRLLPRAASHQPLYGAEAKLPELLEHSRAEFERDGISGDALAVVGGALDGIDRVLTTQLRPGDAVAVEDPTFPRLLHLIAALGLVPRAVELDDFGPTPESLERVLRSGVAAVIVTPRAQNPTGAALDKARSRELRAILAKAADVVVLEDDYFGDGASVPATTLIAPDTRRWAVIRSFTKMLGPDLRTAVLAGDATTVSRVEGRQMLGTGWVSHMLQRLTYLLLTDERTQARVREATETYRRRRSALLEALAARGVEARGRSGFNVWLPVAQEAAAIAALAESGWAVAAGEPFRVASGPGIRITAATLTTTEIERLADDVASALGPQSRTYAA
jgi:DNA-binding transcriptional MocR family regulator